MNLLKQITEDINSYHQFVYSLVEKVEQFEEEIRLEKRLGLRETDYYQNGNPNAIANRPQGRPAVRGNDTIDFKPQPNVAKPQANQAPPKGVVGGMQGRIQLMYNPATGKVEDAKQAQGMEPPAPGYTTANAQQLDDALKHIESIDKSLADKIVAGTVQVFVPQNPQAPKQSPNVQQHNGMNRLEMDPDQLARAKAAADQMSLA